MFYELAGFFAQEHAQEAAHDAAQAATEAPQPPAELLFHIFGLPVTNSILTAWVVIAVLVLFAYWFVVLPISYLTVHNEEGHVVPLLRSADSDLNVTAAMAILMIVIAEVFEFKSLGVFGYIKG